MLVCVWADWMTSLLGCESRERGQLMLELNSEGSRKMAQWLNCLLQNYESLSLHPQRGYINQIMMPCACNQALVGWRQVDPKGLLANQIASPDSKLHVQ